MRVPIFGTFLEHLEHLNWNIWNMLVLVTEAAKLTGKTRQTINRHVRTGKLSAKHENGKKVIDTSELIRVYGEIKMPNVPKSGTQKAENVPVGSNEQNKLIADLIAQVERLTKVVDHLTLRLEYKPPAQQEKTKLKPEDDPDWPLEVKSFKDVALRNEIKAKYH